MLWLCVCTSISWCEPGGALIKKRKMFPHILYKELLSGSDAKSYMRKGFLIYEEMRKYLVIYGVAVSQIWLCTRSFLNFLIYEENFVFFFISEEVWSLTVYVRQWCCWCVSRGFCIYACVCQEDDLYAGICQEYTIHAGMCQVDDVVLVYVSWFYVCWYTVQYVRMRVCMLLRVKGMERGVLGNKCAGHHNLKTVKIRETMSKKNIRRIFFAHKSFWEQIH